MSDALSQLDLAFCVDLTGSMGGFIASAKAHMAQVLEALQAPLGDGLKVAIVGYRDHSDGPKLLEVHPLDSNLKRVSAALQQLSVGGGGDAPEAVYAGLKACLELKWTQGSYRVVVLVGDAPPHGVGAPGDSYRQDPTGYTLDDMANRLETEGLFVHALSMQPHDRLLASAFQRLSVSTGGAYHDASGADAAMRIVAALTQSLLSDIEFDRRLLAKLREGVPLPVPSSDDDIVPSRAELLAKHFKVEVHTVHGGIMRLRRRHLLEGVDV